LFHRFPACKISLLWPPLLASLFVHNSYFCFGGSQEGIKLNAFVQIYQLTIYGVGKLGNAVKIHSDIFYTSGWQADIVNILKFWKSEVSKLLKIFSKMKCKLESYT
jgi:hypothetical protein